MRFWTQIETYLSLSFTFKVSYIQKDLCLLKNMKFSEKQFLKFIFLLAIFVWWFVCLLLLLCTIKSKLWHNKTMWFEMLMTGLVNIVKYTYGGFSDIVFHALVCVTIGSTQVWFYDASVQCYSLWQKGMLVFGLLYVFPFPFTLYLGMKLLKRNTITGWALLLGTICPLPCFMYWLTKVIRVKITKQISATAKGKHTDQCWSG